LIINILSFLVVHIDRNEVYVLQRYNKISIYWFYRFLLCSYFNFWWVYHCKL